MSGIHKRLFQLSLFSYVFIDISSTVIRVNDETHNTIELKKYIYIISMNQFFYWYKICVKFCIKLFFFFFIYFLMDLQFFKCVILKTILCIESDNTVPIFATVVSQDLRYMMIHIKLVISRQWKRIVTINYKSLNRALNMETK